MTMILENTIDAFFNLNGITIILLVGMGHHALAGRAPLLEGGAMAQWKDGGWRRGRVNGLRGKWSQGTHSGSITICKEGMI